MAGAHCRLLVAPSTESPAPLLPGRAASAFLCVHRHWTEGRGPRPPAPGSPRNDRKDDQKRVVVDPKKTSAFRIHTRAECEPEERDRERRSCVELEPIGRTGSDPSAQRQQETGTAKRPKSAAPRESAKRRALLRAKQTARQKAVDQCLVNGTPRCRTAGWLAGVRAKKKSSGIANPASRPTTRTHVQRARGPVVQPAERERRRVGDALTARRPKPNHAHTLARTARTHCIYQHCTRTTTTRAISLPLEQKKSKQQQQQACFSLVFGHAPR